MVVSGRRHSISVAVAAVASGRRRHLPADLLQVVVSVEILPAVVAAVVVVGRRCFHCRSRQSF